ncbi:MAG: UbiA family prenyltransferase [Bacteroidia bacterium]|nr:UbiA family prenyltransferase [Bacteroidia bacterium]
MGYFRFLVYKNVFIGLCSLSLFQVTLMLNNGAVSFTPGAVIVCCATILYYNFHHYSNRLSFTSVQSLKQSILALEIKPLERLLLLVCLIASFAAIFFASFKILVLFFILVIVSVLYSFPIITYKGVKIRLRENLYFKLPILSFSWAIATVLIPLIELEIQLTYDVFIVQFLSTAIFICILCLPFEIRDIEKERSWGVKTIPVVFGIKFTKRMGFFLTLIAIILQLFLFSKAYYSISILIAFHAITVMAYSLLHLAPRHPSDWYCKFYVDGMMIVQFLFVFVSLKF